MRDLDMIFKQLGTTQTTAHSSIAGHDLSRLLLYGPEARPPVRVDVAWDASAEQLRVSWETLPASIARQEFLVHFGYDAHVRVEQGADGLIGQVTQKRDYMLSMQPPEVEWHRGATDRLSITCHLPAVPGSNKERLHVLLASCRYSPGADRTESAVYLPLVIKD